MSRDEIIIRNPLDREMRRRDWPLRGAGQKLESNRCPAKEHRAGHFCMTIDIGKGLWKCHACDIGGSIIDFLAAAAGISPAEAMQRLGGNGDSVSATAAPRSSERPPESSQRNGPQKAATGKIVATYTYADAKGSPLYQVCRMEPKDFRQRRKDESGGWVWNLEGVARVLYNLPKVLATDFVWLLEGEKDADLLNGFGFVASCNVGGAGKWSADYTETLRGKDVVLCGDTDEPGKKHMEKVRAAIESAVKTLRIVELPAPFKDVSDFIGSYADPKDGARKVVALADAADVLVQGQRLPIKSMAELEEEYGAFARNVTTRSFRFSDWLPSTYHHIRPIVPGELVTFIAGTGVGKTMLLQNMAVHTRLPTLLFEMELPGTLSFERFAAVAVEKPGSAIFDAYYGRETVDWRGTNKLDHIHVCSEPRVSPAELERIVMNAGLKMGMKPVLVLIDYVQLIQGKGDRYERISDAMEGLKIIAKATNTIVVIASQIARKDQKAGSEVFLCDAKESGSIENSSGLVLGAWRDDDPNHKSRLWLKIMKNTKGVSGYKVACKIGDGLTITES